MKIPADHAWILGYIDPYDAVHSISAPAYAIHDDYFPRLARRRWRTFVGSRELTKIDPDYGMEKLYEITNEDRILIEDHLVKKH